MADRFDAVVIGTGPAGEVAAGELADGGMKVAAVERELVGGECGYWACIPSKTMLRPAEALAAARHAPGAREAVTGELAVAEALGWRDFMTSGWDDKHQVEWLDEKGVELVRGQARITGPGKVRAGDRTLDTERVLVATGSDPAIPPIDGLDSIDYWTNRGATETKEIPERLIVLGGGPVGIELAQAFARYGSSVALVEGSETVLAREAGRVGEALQQALADDGVELHTGLHARSVGGDKGVTVELDDGTSLRGDRLLVATGRRARSGEVGLDAVGIEPGKQGIEVDEQLRAGEGVWAVGDVTGISMFTHVGKYQARIAARDMLGKEARASYGAIPRVVFSDPQVAAVGRNEEQAREAGVDVVSSTIELAEVTRTSTYTRDYDKLPGFLTLVADRRRRVLVGAYAVGPEAGEWLQQATLAVRAEVPVDVLRDTIQPFPTFSEGFVDALGGLDL